MLKMDRFCSLSFHTYSLCGDIKEYYKKYANFFWLPRANNSVPTPQATIHLAFFFKEFCLISQEKRRKELLLHDKLLEGNHLFSYNLFLNNSQHFYNKLIQFLQKPHFTILLASGQILLYLPSFQKLIAPIFING